MRACGDPRRNGGWITEPMVVAYVRMHELGWVHSVESWSEQGELVGGLYGIAIGGFFAGESMFSRAVDASKVALVDLVDGCGAPATGCSTCSGRRRTCARSV
jgi:leucyl/phenylalanyl-tRNA--protein transferase